MKKSKYITELFSLNTVRKKVLILSKVAGVTIILFYIVAESLNVNTISSSWIWLVLLIAVILGVNFLLGRFISKPLMSINKSASQMADLDFSAHCDIKTNDEFGELSQSLNTMFANLQETLKKLENANIQLEADVLQERLLLTQRKELADTLSHEMKTPLGVIQAYTEALKDETNDIKKDQYMDAIISATQRMDNLIVSLLDLSALESGALKLKLERFDFIELSETVAGRILIDTPNQNYEFSYELPEEKIYVSADKKRIEQVLENLIINAKKYVVDNGGIKLSVILNQNILRFSIFNQCETISENELSKIWTKFYRLETHQNKGGSGLGLAIVSEILAIHKADYGADNLKNGIEFYFCLPIIL